MATADNITLPSHETALIHIKHCFKNYGVVAFFNMAKHYERNMFLLSSFTINILQKPVCFYLQLSNSKEIYFAIF